MFPMRDISHLSGILGFKMGELYTTLFHSTCSQDREEFSYGFVLQKRETDSTWEWSGVEWECEWEGGGVGVDWEWSGSGAGVE